MPSCNGRDEQRLHFKRLIKFLISVYGVPNFLFCFTKFGFKVVDLHGSVYKSSSQVGDFFLQTF